VMSCFTSSRAHGQHTLLVAGADEAHRGFLTAQLDADGHVVYDADRSAVVAARLSSYPVDVLVLGELQRPADAPGLVRAIRAGELERVHPGLAIITMGAGDELSALRAYEAGSDHHLPSDSGYVLLRAVITTVLRRTVEQVTRRHLRVGAIHIDLAARTVTVADSSLNFSRLDFALLVTFASDPERVFSKDELGRRVWRCHVSGRTVDSHVCHLRTRLTAAGAGAVLINRWGHGWSLTTPANSHPGDTCLPVTRELAS
jgi:DNA-binding response OmpR family regulator